MIWSVTLISADGLTKTIESDHFATSYKNTIMVMIAGTPHLIERAYDTVQCDELIRTVVAKERVECRCGMMVRT